jgi:integrase
MRLTKDTIKALAADPGDGEKVIFDDLVPGFGARRRSMGGSVSLFFQYRSGKKQRRLSLGRASATDLTKARKTAGDMYAQVRLGGDPAREKEQSARSADETFEALAQQYLQYQRTRVRAGTYLTIENYLTMVAKPLHALPLDKIERRNVASVLLGIKGAVSSNRVRTSLSSFFRWAIEHGLADANPVIGTKRHKETSRERALSDAELRAIWPALGEGHFGCILTLLILTGARATEIGSLRWSEVNLDEAVIKLPPERVKNSREHVIPLSDTAATILAAQPRRAGRDLVFGIGQGGFDGFSPAKRSLDARIAAARGTPLPHWVIHDLRRSAATGMAELGIASEVIEAVLNHISGSRRGVAGIYNRSRLEAQKRRALDQWAQHLRDVIEGNVDKVVPLRTESAVR